MKVLLFGPTGQLGTEIRRLAGAVEIDACGRDRADFTDPDACARIVARTDADAIVNAAAYTQVDKAETEEPLAHRINADAPGAIAEAAARRGVPLVHVSTDYVFDGSGSTPRNLEDPTAPINAYGRTKLAGEERIRAAGGGHVILRTSWVVSAHGANFVRTVLRLAKAGGPLRIVDDQVGGLTPAADLARACLVVAERLRADPNLSGTYHFAGGPDASWAEVARAVLSAAGLAQVPVTPIPSSEYLTAAPRPLNSRLETRLFEAVFGLARPDWRGSLTDILTEMGEP